VDLGKLDSSTLRPIYGDSRPRQLAFGNNWRRGFDIAEVLRAARRYSEEQALPLEAAVVVMPHNQEFRNLPNICHAQGGRGEIALGSIKGWVWGSFVAIAALCFC
jgi:hypothetical protein